jgi:anti-sigma B factor antagonist
MSSGDRSILRFEGDLDIVTSEEMKQRLAALVETEATGTIAIDLRDVGFVDSSGLGALVAVHHYAVSKGSKFVVREVPPHVRDLFALTRLDSLLQVE